jgi:hypothetical protein
MFLNIIKIFLQHVHTCSTLPAVNIACGVVCTVCLYQLGTAAVADHLIILVAVMGLPETGHRAACYV